MSGINRKVSKSLVNSAVSTGTGSHSQFKQSENQLKQKLEAIDTSFKLSNKKISKETRELRQILFDLQRELKVSKSPNQYVSSSIEEQRGQLKRQRRITVATTAPGPLSAHTAVCPKKYSPEMPDTGSAVGEGEQDITTKRKRKISEQPVHETKVLLQEDDVSRSEYKSTERVSEENDFSGETYSAVETDGVLLAVEHDFVNQCEKKQSLSDSLEQEGQQTNTSKQEDLEQDTSDAILTPTSEQRAAEKLQTNANLFSVDNYGAYSDLRSVVDLGLDSRVRPNALSSQGMFSFSSSNSPANNNDTVKQANKQAFAYGLGYSKHFNEDRKRSLSDSDANYRDAFKGRFITPALPDRLIQNAKLQLPAPETQKRLRRVTVSGPPPMDARRLLDIGDIPVTGRFSPGTKVRTGGRGPIGRLLPLSKGADNEENDKSGLDGGEKDSSRGRYNLTVSRPQDQKQRSSSVRKTSSYLPPLKEETRNAATANITHQWKNLENCRYLRKGDEELSIDDVFRKD